MRAVRLKAQVTRDHTLHLELPRDIGAGPAEVIILVEDSIEESAEHSEAATLQDFLASSRTDRRFLRSKEQIDESLAAERASWE